MTTTILFVPGFWEGPAPFARVLSLLQSQGYSAQAAVLPSTGKASPGNPGMKDDIAAVRSTIAELVDAGEIVVLVLHSAGGFLGSNAAEGLDLKARRKLGLEGGIRRIVFLAGAIFPEGYKHTPLPFFTYDVCFAFTFVSTSLHVKSSLLLHYCISDLDLFVREGRGNALRRSRENSIRRPFAGRGYEMDKGPSDATRSWLGRYSHIRCLERHGQCISGVRRRCVHSSCVTAANGTDGRQ